MSNPENEYYEFECAGKTVKLYLPDRDDHIQKVIRTTSRFYEAELLEELAARLTDEPGVIIDVGANIGNHTIYFAVVLDREVIAYEPNPKAFQILERSVEANDVNTKVRAFQVAIGELATTGVSIERSKDNLGASVFEAAVGGEIECRPLDDLLEGVGRVALIKIDVEGDELSVVRGAKHIIATSRPILCIESATREAKLQIDRELGLLGYATVSTHNATPTHIYISMSSLEDLPRVLFDRLESDADERRNEHLRLMRQLRKVSTIIKASSEDSRVRRLSHELQNAAEDIREKSARIDALLAKSKELEAKVENQQKELDRLRSELKLSEANRKDLNLRVIAAERNLNRVRASLSFALGHLVVQAVRRPVPRLILLPFSLIRLLLDRISARKKSAGLSKLTLTWPIRASAYWKRLFRKAAVQQPPLVSVIMPAFNSAESIGKAIRSVLDQDHGNLELLVVDDASSDATVATVEKFSMTDPRVRLLRMHRNMGPYWAKNFAMLFARGDFVTFHDSDDWSHPARIAKQISLFKERPEVKMVTVGFSRIDCDGNVVLNRGMAKRMCLATMMFRTHEFRALLGSFDIVRYGADYELYTRAKRMFGVEGVANCSDVYYYASVRSESLTAKDRVELDVHQAAPEGAFLSPSRQRYVESFTAWHASCDAKSLRYSFPRFSRSFDVPEKMSCLTHDLKNRQVVATIASMPSRVASLAKVVDAIYPQVDRLAVYLNNYDEVPAFLKRKNIVVARSQDHGDLKDNGKFFFRDEVRDAIHFTLDDDINYPSNYVSYMLAKLIQYDMKVAVGVHGVIFDPEFKKFLRRRYVYHFEESLREDRIVNLLGTGTLAYDARAISLSCEDFSTTGMVDIWFARAAREGGVPLVAVERSRRFLSPISPKSDQNLMTVARRDDEVHTKLVAEVGSWCPERYLQDKLLQKLGHIYSKNLFQ